MMQELQRRELIALSRLCECEEIFFYRFDLVDRTGQLQKVPLIRQRSNDTQHSPAILSVTTKSRREPSLQINQSGIYSRDSQRFRDFAA